MQHIVEFLKVVPENLWQQLKKFVTKDETIVFDMPFKISTKYSAALLTILICLSGANQFVRNVELDCRTVDVKNSHREFESQDHRSSELNDYCWNHETFLVVKALDPKMRGMVTYPGIHGYDRGTDELVGLRYYKYIWLIFAQLGIMAFLPYFFWKARGVKKMKRFVALSDLEEYSETDQLMMLYLESIGFNDGFAWLYVLCKILATLSPLAQWFYLSGFIGQRFKYYGLDVVLYFLDNSDPWPNPMDALFPKIAKCEWSIYGFSADFEVKAAQCQLPMNNITQWSFFVYWYWMTLVFILNLLSLLYLFIHIFPFYRRYKYCKFIAAVCRNEVTNLMIHNAPGANKKKKNIQKSKNEYIYVNMSFGDWLVLSFIKKNLEDCRFRDFVRKMAFTKNTIIQLKPPSMIIYLNEKGEDENPNDEGQHNMEKGYKKELQGDGQIEDVNPFLNTITEDKSTNIYDTKLMAYSNDRSC